jgi:hypothetical protein
MPGKIRTKNGAPSDLSPYADTAGIDLTANTATPAPPYSAPVPSIAVVDPA